MDSDEVKVVLIGGAVAVGVGLLFVRSKSSSTTYAAPGTGAATAIAAAQQSDYALGEQTKVALANTAAGVYENSDNNSTQLKLAAIQGASSEDLASLAAASTYNNLVESDKTTTAKNVLDYTEQQYQTQMTGIAAHDTNTTALAEANIAAGVANYTSGAAIKIAQSQATTQQYAAKEATLASEAASVQQAQAEVQVSGNQASASKSASMWGGISGIVGGLAKAIPFFSGTPDGSGTSVVPVAFNGKGEYDAVGSAVAQQQYDNSGPFAFNLTSLFSNPAQSFSEPLPSIRSVGG